MTIKVNYDTETTLVKGYYPDSIKYASIPDPFIEIEDSEQDNSKQMCVVNGVYQEFQRPLEELLQEAKTSKLAQLNQSRKDFCLMPIEYQGNTYATTLNGWAAITRLENRLATLSSTADYPNYPQGVNVTLTKADFTNIGDLIQVREMESRNRRKLILDQIKAINIDEQYFDENDQEITALEALNAINIDF